MHIRHTPPFFSTAAIFAILTGFSSTAAAQKSAQEELHDLVIHDAMTATLFASEPLISNPAAIDVDSKGRVWVAEIRQYRGAAKVDPPADAIKVLEDVNGDGQADKVTTFAENVFCPMSVCVAGSKVYVATSPDLWVYEDANGDLKADGPPTKLITGFRGFNHDHGAHSLVLGPDHKWWMSHGDEGFDVTGVDGTRIQSQWGAMLRGELNGGQLETVATNFRNPYEICVTSFGEAYCSDNDNDGNESVRICWILDGGDYGWFGRPPFNRDVLDSRVPKDMAYREAWHFRGYQPGYVPGTKVTGFGSPCGICVLEHDKFGKELEDAQLHCDAGPKVVRAYQHTSSGAGKTMNLYTNLMTSKDDGYFRPIDICTAPDGSLLVGDWYDGGVGGHAYNDPNRGRIFRLVPKNSTIRGIEPAKDIGSATDAIEVLKNPNLATQYLARDYLLSHASEAEPLLAALSRDGLPREKARALWVLDRMNKPTRVLETLKDSDASMRALAIRILRRHGEKFASHVLALSKDPSWEVKREVLLAISTLPQGLCEKELLAIAADFDGSDRYLLETLNIAAKNHKRALFAALAARDNSAVNEGVFALMFLLDNKAAEQYILARCKQAVQPNDIKTLIPFLFAIESTDAAIQLTQWGADKSLDAELRGRAIQMLSYQLTPNWRGVVESPLFNAEVKEWLRGPAPVQEATLNLLESNRLPRFLPEIVGMAKDKTLPAPLRIRALRLVVDWNAATAADDLRQLARDQVAEIAEAAQSGLINLLDGPTVNELLTSNDRPLTSRVQMVERLMMEPRGPWLVLALADQNSLVDAVKQRAVAMAADHPDASVRVLFEKYLPKESIAPRLGDEVKAETILALEGNAKKGEQIFNLSSAAQCRRCHAVDGRGGKIGPELTKIGAKYERGAMLETILQPSKAVAPEYTANLIVTTEGQTYIGFVTDDPSGKKLIRTAEGGQFLINPSSIDVLQKQDKSLMPELVLKDISAQDAADLLAYLSSLK